MLGFRDNENAIDRYREKVGAFGHKLIHETDEALACCPEEDVQAVLAAANLRMAIICESKPMPFFQRCSIPRALP